MPNAHLQAVLQACRLRLRPILMTSFAFILGVLPLVVATGAGAEMRRALGTAVFAGMLGVTLFGVLLTPVFFSVIDRLTHLHLFRQGPLARIAAGTLAVLQPRVWWNVSRRGVGALARRKAAVVSAGEEETASTPTSSHLPDT